MPQGDSQALELVESVSSLNRTLRQLAHVGEGGQKVGFAAMGVLIYVYRNQPTRATDVAQWIGIGPAALSRQVADLESLGLLTRTQCSKDARVQLISLTPEGTDEVDRAYKRRTDLLSELLSDWGPTEIAEAAATVNRIQQALRAGIDLMQGKTPSSAESAPEGRS
ncbi:MarR family winged helix-turn-helix transcriptional regulator [Paeniglutamicibacter sp. R2-26]|uniref:MarR family winged helix-turn-helix transcriptional regulator n=1 Tax=Paeniglutamicibacter sp. R2-26 TaxID=3144417 RepID=UPI003EE7F753